MPDNENTNLPPGGAGAPPPPAGAGSAEAAAAAAAAGAGGDTIPYDKDPKVQEYIARQVEKRAEARAAELARTTTPPAPARGGADDFKLPEEMPLPTPTELEEAGMEPKHAAMIQKIANTMLHNERVKQARVYHEQTMRIQASHRALMADIDKAIDLADKEFGALGFGSLRDRDSAIWQKVNTVVGGDRRYQTSGVGYYQGVKLAVEQLKAEQASRTGVGEELLGGGGGRGGGGPGGGRPSGFKALSFEEYRKLSKPQQEEYDRKTVGL